MTHQADTTVYYRKLNAAWKRTEQNKVAPDPIITKLFALAIEDAKKRKRARANMFFTHTSKNGKTKFRQQYRLTTLGRIVLIPRQGSGLNELPSNIGITWPD